MVNNNLEDSDSYSDLQEDLKNDEEKESLSRKDEYLNDLKELGLEEEEVEERATLSLPLNKGDRSSILRLNNIAIEYKAMMEGKRKEEGKETYIQTGRALASQKFIDTTYGIINSFSEQANLVADKDEDTFMIQFVDAFHKINDMMLLDRSITAEYYRPIIKIIKDRLRNLGDILTNNPENMRSVIGGLTAEIPDGDLLK